MILLQGGVYLLTLWDTFAGAPLLFVVLTQAVAVSWFYGKKKTCFTEYLTYFLSTQILVLRNTYRHKFFTYIGSI